MNITNDGSKQTDREKKIQLFRTQKQTLDTFLNNGAISRAQYDKSLGDLRAKMGIDELTEDMGQTK